MFNINIILQTLWTSFATSTYFVLFAVAFAMTLKVTKIWNFAQPGVMTIAFYIMFVASSILRLPPYLSIVISLVVTLLASLALERYGFQTLRRRKSSGLAFFIFTFIFSQFIAYLFSLLIGTAPFTLVESVISPVILVQDIVVTHWDLKALLITAVLMGLLYVFLRWSKPGQFLTAVSDNDRLAEVYGISSKQAYAVSMVIAGIFSVAGMYLLGTRIAVYPFLTFVIILFPVSATILGGIGSVFGAAIAAVMLNFLQGFSILVIPSRWQGLLLYFFLFIIIIFIPRGFLSLIRTFGSK